MGMDFSRLVFPFRLQKKGLKPMREDRQADSPEVGLLQGLMITMDGVELKASVGGNRASDTHRFYTI